MPELPLVAKRPRGRPRKTKPIEQDAPSAALEADAALAALSPVVALPGPAPVPDESARKGMLAYLRLKGRRVMPGTPLERVRIMYLEAVKP